MEFYSATRKKEIPPFASIWMGLEGIILSELSQTVNDKCSHMWNLKKKKAELVETGGIVLTTDWEVGEMLVKGSKLAVGR